MSSETDSPKTNSVVDKLKTVEIKWLEINQGLCEAVSSGMEIALANKKNEQCCVFVHCKDYLQDAIQAHHLNDKRSIYGFAYDPKVHPKLSLDRTRILVGQVGYELHEKIPNMIDFFNSLEKHMGLIKTTVKKVSNPKNIHKKSGCFLFRSSSRWMASPPMISLYTLLLRVSPSHPIGESALDTLKQMREGKITTPRNGDGSYLKSAEMGINKIILNNGHKKLWYKTTKNNYPEKISVGSMHNYGGIISYSRESLKKDMPYWYRELDEKDVVTKDQL